MMLVNSVVTVDTEKDDTSPETPGSRLRDYIDARWSRSQGGILGLARQLNVSTETMYEWFRSEREPNLDHLTRLAEKLDVRRSAILAAMDGDAPVLPLDQTTRAMVREEVRRILDEERGTR